ncbi:hypothetical protein PVAP13_7KG052609 [Panicum virgatum]|uniref:Uncharacterized protein n=1 Tax=Panicum virgatum TaxID=38727 RepID=A0A8T0QAM7_PANVG|nr:hypothetical protein PVAP13_7KG052609 [Panicum virgatum]
MQYEPEAGSTMFFFDTTLYFIPVNLLWPIFPPGRTTSVGWSKLCHKILVGFRGILYDKVSVIGEHSSDVASGFCTTKNLGGPDFRLCYMFHDDQIAISSECEL